MPSPQNSIDWGWTLGLRPFAFAHRTPNWTCWCFADVSTSEEVPTDGTQSILGQKTTSGPMVSKTSLYGARTHQRPCKNSPFYHALDTQTPIRIPLVPPPTNSPFPIIEDLVAREMTDYLVHPLASDTHVSVALSLVSQRPGGFPPAFMDALDAFVPLLSLSVGFKVERIQFQEVLSAYIGTEPASFVFRGQIHRGDVVSRECALGFADLRGFSYATETLATHNVIALVSTFFELVYRAVYGVGVKFSSSWGMVCCLWCQAATTHNRPTTLPSKPYLRS